MDNWDRYTYYEKLQHIIAPIGGIGLGLWISIYFEGEYVAFGIGIIITFICACCLASLNFLKRRIEKLEAKKK